MNSELFRLDIKDFVKGAIVAVVTAIIAYLGEAVKLPGFNLLTFDWHSVISLAISAFGAYLIKNFMSDSDGKVLGRIG
jgi:hypothetical protein